jgi:hypothetical protein
MIDMQVGAKDEIDFLRPNASPLQLVEVASGQSVERRFRTAITPIPQQVSTSTVRRGVRTRNEWTLINSLPDAGSMNSGPSQERSCSTPSAVALPISQLRSRARLGSSATFCTLTAPNRCGRIGRRSSPQERAVTRALHDAHSRVFR